MSGSTNNSAIAESDDVIFSPELLTSQFCTYCLKYLSVGPILSPHPSNLYCGRCSRDIFYEEEFQESIVPQSLYHLIAEKMIFRCINYYLGCRKLLVFNEAVEHEESCSYSGTLDCPFCEYSDNGCSLFNHFKLRHPRYIYNHGFPPLSLNTNESNKIICTKYQCMLGLHIHVGEKIVQIFNLLLTWRNEETRFDFRLRFFTDESFLETAPITVNGDRGRFSLGCDILNNQIIAPGDGILFTVMMKECFPSGKFRCKAVFIDSDYWRDLAADKDYFTMLTQQMDYAFSSRAWEKRMPKISRGIGFYLDHIAYLYPSNLVRIVHFLDMLQICANCKKYIADDVYTCPRYHLACERCCQLKCARCKQFCRWNKKSKLHRVKLQCDWPCCDCSVNIFEYMTHKRDCFFRQYRCPGCEFVGCKQCLKHHWHLGILEYGGSLDVRENYSTYWLKHNELFRITSDFIRVAHSSEHSRLIVGVKFVDVMLKGYRYDMYNLRPEQKSGRDTVPIIIFCGEIQGQRIHFIRAEIPNLQNCFLSMY